MKEFLITKEGYDIKSVDNYINRLLKEISGYKKRIEIIQDTIISAQLAIDSISTNSKRQIFHIKEDVQNRIEKNAEHISKNLINIKRFINDFKSLEEKYLNSNSYSNFEIIINKIFELECYLNEFMEGENN